jgi:hypothetical protein
MMNGQTTQTTQTYDGNIPVTLILTLGNCQLLLQLLSEMVVPWKVVNPLIMDIQGQVKSMLERTPPLEQGQGPRQES